MRALLLIALLLAADALARPKPKPKAKRPRSAPSTQPSAPQGPGQITFVTTTTAYLDRGILDGLAVGSAITVTRAGRLVGRCTIATVADKWATCSAQSMKVGDRVAVDRELNPPPPGPAPVLDGTQLELRRRRAEAVPLPLVDFAGGSGGILGGRGRVASIAASHSTWLNFASAGGPFNVQRIDVGVYDVQIWRGLHGSADVSILNFSQWPATARLPLGKTAILVRQLELSFHSPDLPLLAQVGRTWTRHTPGLLILDGAQAAWRNRDDSIEVGAYGGLLPEPIGLGLSTRRWAVGAFAMGRFESGRGARSSMFQVEARLGYAVRGALAGRLELAAAAHAWLTRAFDAHLQLELAALGVASAGFVDAVRFDFGWRPTDTLRLFASGRYVGTAASEGLEVGVAPPGGQRAFRANAGFTFDVSPSVSLGASAGSASDFASALTQVHVGPELTFPSLLGGTTALTLGYQEELGWLRGRSAWLQLTFTPVSRLRILARGSWFHQQLTIADEGIAGQEIGAALIVDVAITRWLWVRVTAHGRGSPR